MIIQGGQNAVSAQDLRLEQRYYIILVGSSSRLTFLHGQTWTIVFQRSSRKVRRRREVNRVQQWCELHFKGHSNSSDPRILELNHEILLNIHSPYRIWTSRLHVQKSGIQISWHCSSWNCSICPKASQFTAPFVEKQCHSSNSCHYQDPKMTPGWFCFLHYQKSMYMQVQ